MSILVFNAGSSNLKFECFEEPSLRSLASGSISFAMESQNARLSIRNESNLLLDQEVKVLNRSEAAMLAIQALSELGVQTSSIRVVGHRVVHGGSTLRDAMLIDENVYREIQRLAELAPLHNPAALEVIMAAQQALANVPQVAVFDTAFFAQLPQRAQVYPLPYEWYSDYGIRRFGFHGISHDYCSTRVSELLNRDRQDLLLVTCHLGNGCSATAIQSGRPIATTMGFTPLEGLMMGTRPGSIDPGILLHLQRSCGMDLNTLADAIHHRSGLIGVSGVSRDYRDVETAAMTGNERARLALDIYSDRVRSAIGDLAVTLGGIDAVVFTGGVGENSSSLRLSVCQGLKCLGIQLDENLNASCQPDMDIATMSSGPRIFVLRCREEMMIARYMLDL